MKYFLFILATDLFSQDNSIPWYVHGVVLALASLDVVVERFASKSVDK